jgi:SAM-dependent methyltransferase
MTNEPGQGEAYERYLGRWSLLAAREFVSWLAVPAEEDWLDVACGTGALTQAIVDGDSPHSVIGVDPSPEFVAYAAARLRDPRVTFKTGSANALPMGDMSCDAVVSGLALNFILDKKGMMTEMRRVARRGAWIALYVWDYAGEMQMLRRFWDAAIAVDPAAKAFDEGVRYAYCKPAPLVAAFKEMGFGDIECRVIDVPTVFASFDDYWRSLTEGNSPAATYCAAAGEVVRTKLREKLQPTLPRGTDGSIALTARAFALRGRRT